MRYNEEELKETIFDATYYFRKGNEEKIFGIITQKLKAYAQQSTVVKNK